MRVRPAAPLTIWFLGLWLSGPWLVAPLHAQLMLQGAVATPSPEGKGKDKESAAASARPAKAMPLPRAETLLGRDLARGGAAGRMTFARNGKDLILSRLAMTGELISNPAEKCELNVAVGDAVAIASAGQPAGLARYDVQLPVCPFSFDVLDGAVLVSAASQTCDFAAADCRVSPTGLWGPPGTSFNAERAKAMARALVATEAGMRADFRALLKKADTDQAAVKTIAAEQAGFSSGREMLCRDYAFEARHGFCALRITEAKLFALQARLGLVAKDDAGKEKAIKEKATPKTPAKPVARTAQPAQTRAPD